ncbi:putative redox protein [Desulfotomaculum arcticum]|uniref:Putative redox protein n=1 Tax=Desulfotruncus arcticus DSM 17038 TaxID=1121424 RepID=A0A1I2QIF3_9FIRM|nr:alpha/beta hydrolase [Desulfotruncus arcticus]SFG25381.1 putative redox protein [Desulfotomaculum arcticum] [Desulfotruncus arcticus DSM 17038]
MTSGQAWERISFINSHKLCLAGLLHAPGGPSGPVVIVCHGFTGSKEGGGRAQAMGEELGNRGFNVFLFDFSGNGQSEGLFERITLSGQIDDLNSAVDWCTSAGMGPVFTVGRSFGGTTVICHAAGDQRVSGVCTWAAPASLKDIFTEFVEGPVDESGDMYALAGDEGIVYLRRSFFDDLDRFDVPQQAGKIAPRPLLIIHGEKDNVVPPEDAGLIFQNAGEPRELLYIPGADHQFSNHTRKVWDTMFDWLDRIKLSDKKDLVQVGFLTPSEP